jgi:acyl carrier protein
MQKPTTNENIKTTIRQFIVKNFLFGDDDNEFRDDDSFLEKGIVDSTGILELIEYIEDQFKIKTEDEELIPDNFDSINNVVNYISRKTAACGVEL